MENRFFYLNFLIATAFEEKDFAKTESLIAENLDWAEQNKENWNYGNAIHISNIFLGLLAIENNDITNAKGYLIKAGQTKGSPQLNTFGPNMLLAKALLEKGETEVVLEYFKLCKKFWKWYMRILFRNISKWKRAIKKGKIPDFRGHLVYHIKGNHPTFESESK